MDTVKNILNNETDSKIVEDQEPERDIKKNEDPKPDCDTDEEAGIAETEENKLEENELEENELEENELEEKEEEPVDAVIKAYLSKDSLQAFLYMEPPVNGGNAPTYDTIMKALMEKKIIYGIDMTLIKDLGEMPVYNEELIIAKGTPPVDDQDAVLKFHFPVTKDIKPKVNENGTVNFHEMGIVENIEAGKILCTKVPVVKGKEGKAVTGKILKPKKGKDKVLPVGKNTIASEDGLQVIADADGQVDFINNRINVLDTFEVRGNVGSETGDIEFVGNVTVFGDVQSGYSINAGGNIRIEGIVEAAHIKAEGSISIMKGMNGMGKGILESKENINCKYMENTIAVAKGSIRSESMSNCQIRCGEDLELIGKRGMLVGGSYVAGQNITAKTIGSDAYTHTEIEIGKDPELYEKLNHFHETIPQIKKEINDLEKIIGFLRQLESVGKLTEEKRELLNNAVHTKQVKRDELNDADSEQQEIIELLAQKSKGKIICKDRIYPGVRVSIGIAKMSINNVFIDCVLTKKEDAIIISSPD